MNLLSSFLMSTALAGEPVDLPQVEEPSVLDLTVRQELEKAMIHMLTTETGLLVRDCHVRTYGQGASPSYYTFEVSAEATSGVHAELTSVNPANRAYLGFKDAHKDYRCLAQTLVASQFTGRAGGYDYLCDPEMKGIRTAGHNFLVPSLSCAFTLETLAPDTANKKNP